LEQRHGKADTEAGASSIVAENRRLHGILILGTRATRNVTAAFAVFLALNAIALWRCRLARKGSTRSRPGDGAGSDST
jgi:hypothetical protein